MIGLRDLRPLNGVARDFDLRVDQVISLARARAALVTLRISGRDRVLVDVDRLFPEPTP